MKRWTMGAAAVLALAAGACDTANTVILPGNGPDAPRALRVWYYGGVVNLAWELGPAWAGESFRVYAKRSTDPDYFLIAEVTNCVAGQCSYTDVNVQAGRTYDYYVAAVDDAGVETPSAEAIRVDVPQPIPPPVPDAPRVVALDGANYLTWSDNARSAGDFAFYRVYLYLDEEAFLLGETDSEGFLDELAENGLTYAYFVTSVDELGHESGGSATAEGTPRPDFHGEAIWDYFGRPEVSGFIFQDSESTDPLVDGDDPARHFRLETDAAGWWLVPGPGVQVYPAGWETTALTCGPGADAGCVALEVAPTSGYVAADIELLSQTTYVLRVPGADGQLRYAALRVQMQGFDQDDNALMIFDWSLQLQPGNPSLAPRVGSPLRLR